MPKDRYMTVLGAYTLDMEQHGKLLRDKVDTSKTGDYGCDPLGDGLFRMVPSGDIVDLVEMQKRTNK
tara:strand:- start:422 stop:622 length:201 start_codon:yes stop_codon:yes gene_type:complete